MIENIKIIKYNEENESSDESFTEWRSQRDFLNYVKGNTCVDKRVVGFITSKTLKKWGIELDMGKALKTINELDMFWLIVEGKKYWLSPRCR